MEGFTPALCPAGSHLQVWTFVMREISPYVFADGWDLECASPGMWVGRTVRRQRGCGKLSSWPAPKCSFHRGRQKGEGVCVIRHSVAGCDPSVHLLSFDKCMCLYNPTPYKTTQHDCHSRKFSHALPRQFLSCMCS